MIRRSTFILATMLLVAGLIAPAGVAAAATRTYELHLEEPNVTAAPNGDQISVLGSGEFQVHPKDVEAAGTFTHTDAGGNVLASGTWEATRLLAFQSYGCGVLVNVPGGPVDLPDNLCGGKLKLRIHLAVDAPAAIAGAETDGILTIFCILGPNPPNSHDEPSEEGIHLVVPGIANFNRILSGMNVYIQTS